MISEMIWPKDTLRKMRQKRYDSSALIVGSFSNDDGDGNEDVKKSIGLD